MIRSGLFAALLLFPAFHAGAQSRFAVLRFEDVTEQLPAFTAIKTWMDTEVRKISKDRRSTEFQKMLDELTRAVAEAKNLPKQTDPKTREEIMAKVEALKVEAESLHADLTEFEKRENLRIKLKGLAEIEAIDARVLAAAARVAKERGFDCVFEAKGFSSTSMPVLVYMRNPADITEDVLAALMTAESAPESAAAADSDSANPDPPEPAEAAPTPGDPAPESAPESAPPNP